MGEDHHLHYPKAIDLRHIQYINWPKKTKKNSYY